VPLGKVAEAVTDGGLDVEPLTLETLPLSSEAVDYPLIREMHAASALTDPAEVRRWRDSPPSLTATPGVPENAPVVPLRPLPTDSQPRESIDAVITRRGSSRRFARQALTLAELSTILDVSTHATPADFGSSVNDLYLIVNAVDDVAPGTYVYRPDIRSIALLRGAELRREAAHLGLGQDLPGDAAVNLYFLCDLEAVLKRFGNRGYRVAQLDAATTAGKMYLAAYALRLGATGLTFFDDDVTRFFSPHAAGKSVMFLIAIGRAARQLVVDD
jgi:hypothetical protein